MNNNEIVYTMYYVNDIFSFKEYDQADYDVKIFEFNRQDIKEVSKLKLKNLNTKESEHRISNKFPFLYILENSDTHTVYIGKSNNIWNRLTSHSNDDKISFNKVYLIGKDKWNDNLLRNIENELINKFKEGTINDFNVENEKSSTDLLLNRADSITFESGFKLVISILNMLGFGFKETNNSPDKKKILNETIFEYQNAKLIISKEQGFVLLKGSTVSKIIPKDNSGRNVINLWNDLKKDGKIDIDGKLIVDVYWSTPSPLASLVVGRTVNGWDMFKNSKGVTLNKFTNRK